MELIWKVYNSINPYIPKSVIQKARFWMEAHFDFWCRQITFSQCGEDIILLALLHGRSINKGFYVDIGAYAPKQFSNTYLLYKQGWRGINIDATPNSMKVFDKVRKRDMNLEVAISDEEKELAFYSWGIPNGCNTFSKDAAERFASAIGKPPTVMTVHAERLEAVLEKYKDRFLQIDVMNVDVEYHTMEVLRSNDWNQWRPSILIVEIFGSTIDDIIASEESAFLLSKGYRMHAWTGSSAFFELESPPKGPKKGIPT